MSLEHWLGIIGLVVSAALGVIRIIYIRRKRNGGGPEVLLDADDDGKNGKPPKRPPTCPGQ